MSADSHPRSILSKPWFLLHALRVSTAQLDGYREWSSRCASAAVGLGPTAAIQGSRCNSVTGHSEIVRDNKFDGSVIAAADGTDEIYTGTGTPHVIDKWEGFLGTCEPKILDAAILPDLIVSIYWASNSVLASCKGNATHANFILAPSSGAAAVFDILKGHGFLPPSARSSRR